MLNKLLPSTSQTIILKELPYFNNIIKKVYNTLVSSINVFYVSSGSVTRSEKLNGILYWFDISLHWSQELRLTAESATAGVGRGFCDGRPTKHSNSPTIQLQILKRGQAWFTTISHSLSL